MMQEARLKHARQHHQRLGDASKVIIIEDRLLYLMKYNTYTADVSQNPLAWYITTCINIGLLGQNTGSGSSSGSNNSGTQGFHLPGY